jgi:peptidoglycan/xylan/chitin deacetylase (PgdA/CDA1 family)
MGRNQRHRRGFRPVGRVLVTFDNLGEAAELAGGVEVSEVGGHFTALEVLPEILGLLDGRGLAATFFVEGLNAELYPDLLREIDARGHEVAYHAWRHEQWGDLTAVEQAANLARGIEAFERIGLRIAGIRPPGGQLGAGGTSVLREAGLRYCSPAGAGASAEGDVALLPFEWPHVDACCVLPALGAARERIGGSAEPVEPADFAAWIGEETARLAEEGGFLAIVLHPFMLAWLGVENLERVLDGVAGAVETGRLWSGRGCELAEQVLAEPRRFAGPTVLDTASWT